MVAYPAACGVSKVPRIGSRVVFTPPDGLASVEGVVVASDLGILKIFVNRTEDFEQDALFEVHAAYVRHTDLDLSYTLEVGDEVVVLTGTHRHRLARVERLDEHVIRVLLPDTERVTINLRPYERLAAPAGAAGGSSSGAGAAAPGASISTAAGPIGATPAASGGTGVVPHPLSRMYACEASETSPPVAAAAMSAAGGSNSGGDAAAPGAAISTAAGPIGAAPAASGGTGVMPHSLYRMHACAASEASPPVVAAAMSAAGGSNSGGVAAAPGAAFATAAEPIGAAPAASGGAACVLFPACRMEACAASVASAPVAAAAMSAVGGSNSGGGAGKRTLADLDAHGRSVAVRANKIRVIDPNSTLRMHIVNVHSFQGDIGVVSPSMGSAGSAAQRWSIALDKLEILASVSGAARTAAVSATSMVADAKFKVQLGRDVACGQGAMVREASGPWSGSA